MRKLAFIAALICAVLLPLPSAAASFLGDDVRIVKQEGDSRLFVINQGKRQHIRDLSILRSYPSRRVETISSEEFERTKSIRLIKSPLGPRVYLLDAKTGQKIWFPTEASFVGSNENWNEIVEISGTDSRAYPNAVLLKISGQPKVYQINYDTLEKVHIKSEADFLAAGFNWKKIVTVPEALLDAFREVDEFSKETVVAPEPDTSNEPEVDNEPEPQEPGAQVVVNQTFRAPVSFATGTSHNVMQRITFRAGDGPANITGLNLTRKGFLLDNDFLSVAVVDDNGFLLAEPLTPSRGVLSYKFAAPFQIEPRETRIITVVAAFERELSSNGQLPVGFSIEKSSDIITNNIVGGSFPIASQLHRVIPAATIIGSLTVSTDPGFSVGNLVVGEKDAVLNSFLFKETSGVEDVALHRVILSLTGSLRVRDFTNFELVDEKNRVVAKDPVVRGQQLAFIFSSPYKIEQNDEQTLKVRADVVSGSDLRGLATIENVYDIRAVGQTHKHAITPDFTDGQSSVGRGEIIEVQGGSVSLNLAKDSPTVGLPRGGDGVVLARFEVRPGSQDLYWRRATIKIRATDGATALPGNVWIREEDGDTLGNVNGINVHNNTQSIGLSSPVLSGNKIYTYEIVADIANTLRVGDGYQAILTEAEFVVVNGGDDIRFAGELSGALRAVQEITLLLRYDGRFEPSAAVAGRTRYEVGRFLLRPSAGEDVTITEIVVEPVGATTQFTDGFSNFNFEGSKIATPTGDKARFAFNKTIRTGSEALFNLYIDTTVAVHDVSVAYEVTSVKAIGKVSEALVDVSLDNAVTPTLNFKKSVIEIEAVSVPEEDKFKNGEAILGAFTLTANSVEDIDLSAFTVVETANSDGTSVSDGYTKLRIERASDRRTVTRTISSPVGGLGGDRLTSGPRIESGETETFYIVADIEDPTGDTIQLSITRLEGKGRSSRLVPFVEGAPILLTTTEF